MANKVYINPESAITFEPSGTPAFTPTSVASGNMRVSAQHDRGSGAKAAWFRWRAKTKLASSTAGDQIDIYIITGDGTIVDGNVGTSDATVAAADKVRNLKPIGTIVVDKSTDAAEPFVSSGVVFIPFRYIQVGWRNDTGEAWSATGTDHAFVLEPIPDELQD
jgi:hypothetical protein